MVEPQAAEEAAIDASPSTADTGRAELPLAAAPSNEPEPMPASSVSAQSGKAVDAATLRARPVRAASPTNVRNASSTLIADRAAIVSNEPLNPPNKDEPKGPATERPSASATEKAATDAATPASPAPTSQAAAASKDGVPPFEGTP